LAKRIGERSWDGTRPAALVLLGLKERGEGAGLGQKREREEEKRALGSGFETL
jgi:hypothetical protein